MAVDIVVDQTEIYRFTQLYTKAATKNDSTFQLVFKDQVYPHPGKISIIDRAVDPQTGSIKMRLVFPNAEHTLRAGMSGTLRVQSKSQKAVVIPYKAISEQLGEFFVYMPDSAKATQRKVSLGNQIGKNIIIKEGLKDGETVIVEGIQSLREGTPINIATPAAAAKGETAKK
jgi:membrane fusion protein (multidrug efflux system)